jgi:hypothetical protein
MGFTFTCTTLVVTLLSQVNNLVISFKATIHVWNTKSSYVMDANIEHGCMMHGVHSH